MCALASQVESHFPSASLLRCRAGSFRDENSPGAQLLPAGGRGRHRVRAAWPDGKLAARVLSRMTNGERELRHDPGRASAEEHMVGEDCYVHCPDEFLTRQACIGWLTRGEGYSEAELCSSRSGRARRG